MNVIYSIEQKVPVKHGDLQVNSPLDLNGLVNGMWKRDATYQKEWVSKEMTKYN